MISHPNLWPTPSTVTFRCCLGLWFYDSIPSLLVWPNFVIFSISTRFQHFPEHPRHIEPLYFLHNSTHSIHLIWFSPKFLNYNSLTILHGQVTSIFHLLIDLIDICIWSTIANMNSNHVYISALEVLGLHRTWYVLSTSSCTRIPFLTRDFITFALLHCQLTFVVRGKPPKASFSASKLNIASFISSHGR